MRNLGLMDPAFLGGLGGGILWTPAQITTALWLDAADSSTITTVGGALSQWNDKSGNVRHGTQAASDNRPTYSSAGLNGAPSIYFAKNPLQFLATPTIANNSIASGRGITLIQVIKVDGNWGSASNSTFLSTVGTRPSNGSYWSFIRNGTNSEIGFHGAAQIWSGVNLESNAAIVLDRVSSSSLLTERINGVTAISSMISAFTGSTSAVMHIGAGSTLSPSDALKGHISEIILITSALNDFTLQRLEGYLAHKWGLTANLPNDHLFKVSPPYV
jgi:hypothetical protein